MPRLSYPPLVEPGIDIKPKGRQLGPPISFEMGGLSVLSEQESATMFNDRYSTDTTDMVR